MDPLVTVFTNWRATPAGTPCLALTLSEALTLPQDCSEPALQPVVPVGPDAPVERLSKAIALAGRELHTTHLVFDFDLKDYLAGLGEKIPWTSVKPVDAEAILAAATDFLAHRGPGTIVHTKHGLHIYIRLPAPLPIGQTGAGFEFLVDQMIKDANHYYGLTFDTSCQDWTHIYRIHQGARLDHFPDNQYTIPFLSLFAQAQIISNVSTAPQIEEIGDLGEIGQEPPSELPIALLAIQRSSPKLYEQLSAKKPPLEMLEDIAKGRHDRTLQGSRRVLGALTMSPYYRPDYAYWILEPIVRGFGQDTSENQSYLSKLPKMIDDWIRKTPVEYRASMAMRESMKPPDEQKTIPEVPADVDFQFAKNVNSYMEDMPANFNRAQALDWLAHHTRLVVRVQEKNLYCPIERDGYYHKEMVSFSALPRAVREKSFPEIIDFWSAEKKGEKGPNGEEPKKIPSKPISEAHFIDKYCKNTTKPPGITFGFPRSVLRFVDQDRDSMRLDLCPIRRNKLMRPTFDPTIRKVFEIQNKSVPFFVRAVAPLCFPEDGPTATTVLQGIAHVGKSLTRHGLGESFDPMGCVPMRALIGQYNNRLTDSYLLYAEEGDLSGGRDGADPATILRTIGDQNETVDINVKMGHMHTIKGLYRAIITCNDYEWIRKYIIKGRRISDASRDAILERMIFVEFNDAAADYLRSLGEETRGWVEGTSSKTQLRWINHLMWEIYCNPENGLKIRTDGTIAWPGGRLLCNGRGLTPPSVLRMFEAPADEAETDTIEAIVTLFNNKEAPAGTISDIDAGFVYVNPTDLHRALTAKRQDRPRTTPTAMGIVLSELRVLHKKAHGKMISKVPLGKILARMEWIGLKSDGRLAKAIEQMRQDNG